jgi:hypothetical protein
MKYITHMTSASDDEKHQAAMDRSGLEIYGAYWIIVEKIAAQIRPECVSTSLQLSWRSWASKLQVDPRVARRLVIVIGEVGLAIVKETGSGARVDIPNLLKYGDEYTKRLGISSRQTPDKLPIVSGLPDHLEHLSISPSKPPSPKNGSVRVLNDYTPDFNEFWTAYPKKIGKLVAFKKFQSVIKNPQYPPADLKDAAEEYADQCKSEKREERFILHPATFLEKDRWKDYCFEKVVDQR